MENNLTSWLKYDNSECSKVVRTCIIENTTTATCIDFNLLYSICSDIGISYHDIEAYLDSLEANTNVSIFFNFTGD